MSLKQLSSTRCAGSKLLTNNDLQTGSGLVTLDRMSDLLTFEEAARFAHVSPETVKYWKKTGRLQTVPKRISKRSGKPYGQLVPRDELLKAMPTARIQDLKTQHPGNLLTVGEIAGLLKTRRQIVYKLIRRYGLEKHRVDGWNFLVDGEVLWDHLEDDPTYYYLTHQ